MYQIQISKKKAPILLPKLPIQTMATQQVKVIQEKPAKENFKSIFSPLWGSSDTLQRMNNGTEAGDNDEIPLVKGRLNVVGEDHDESNKNNRREKEKEYSKLHTNSDNYWKEEEFREQPRHFEELITTENYLETRKFGDPYKLRFFYMLKNLESDSKMMRIITKSLNNLYLMKGLTKAKNFSKFWQNNLDLMDGLGHDVFLFQEIWIMLNELKLNKLDFEFTEAEKS